ncbi:MAG: hypothetical protein KF773_19765 [Deltaproteobacteria bacterium]|nr:hypothetical protein [Deltaproteobacteria bacterium]MCW5806229.1 hypothetical protein [Deltaproteobacteria bacterium]
MAIVIGALTAIAFVSTSASSSERNRTAAEQQVARAFGIVQRLNSLAVIDVRNKVERLAARPEFVDAIQNEGDRKRSADEGFRTLTASIDEQGRMREDSVGNKPDIMALVDKDGRILAMYDGQFVPNQWRVDGDPSRKSTVPGLDYILVKKERVIISDVWTQTDKGMLRVGAAPVINPSDASILGAVVIAYAQTAQNAQVDKQLLGTEIVYFDQVAPGQPHQMLASSFGSSPASSLGQVLDAEQGEKLDLEKQYPQLKTAAEYRQKDVEGVPDAPKQRYAELTFTARRRVTLDGTEYTAQGVRMPRSPSKKLEGYAPTASAGAIVLLPLAGEGGGKTGWLILLVGLGGLAIAMLGLYLSHRRLIAQVDAIELGVIDIINGNVDRTFRPVGPELDGLANGLNVMLARLLGRPEPGEEEFDDEGNPIIPGRVEFDEGEDRPAPDPDLAALAQESEPDYYKRVFTEYQAARKQAGAPDDGSFENFIAKLKVNEGKLKAQYQCRAVRFRVVTKDGKVSLKPVPIFA